MRIVMLALAGIPDQVDRKQLELCAKCHGVRALRPTPDADCVQQQHWRAIFEI